MNQQTLVFYHGNCPDGFGGAYAAWKKFGDTARYIPLKHGTPEAEAMHGKDVYFIDFCFPKEVMDRFAEEAGTFTVLDHHEGVADVARSYAGVYDANHSGAAITWMYFHPDTPLPTLLAHIEDDDLFRFALPDTKALMAYIVVRPYSFDVWDEIAQALDDPSRAPALFEKARTYREYFDLLVQQAADRAKLVNFEGYQVYMGWTQPMKTMVSALGHELAKRQPPFAMLIQPGATGARISMRGDGSIDLTKIAQKYGGNGHPNSVAFSVNWNEPLPWTPVED